MPVPYRPITFMPVPYRPITFMPVPYRPITFMPVPYRPITLMPVPSRPITLMPVPSRPITLMPVPYRPITLMPVHNGVFYPYNTMKMIGHNHKSIQGDMEIMARDIIPAIRHKMRMLIIHHLTLMDDTKNISVFKPLMHANRYKIDARL